MAIFLSDDVFSMDAAVVLDAVGVTFLVSHFEKLSLLIA